MRKIARSIVLAAALLGSASAGLLGFASGAQAALNGTLYAVAAPMFDGSNGSTSFVRLYGGVASASSTFSIRVVNTTTGANLGNLVTISVPKNAAPQFSFGTILTMAGAAQTRDHNYALYIQNPEPTAGYQHVSFNGTSSLFENIGVCANLLNQSVTAAYPSLVLTNLHTDRLAAGYPSEINIHNYWNAAVTYGVFVYDAGSADNAGAIRAGAGAMMGSKTYTVGANSTLNLTFVQLQQAIGWSTSDNQLHANIIITETSNQAPAEVLTSFIVNKALGGAVNMSSACAVNAPPAATTGGGGTIGGGDSGAYLN